jgi:four helix bundle protein
MENAPIKSFRDLIVYQNSYSGCIIVAKEILPKLPDSEKYDLKDQLSRSSKAVPRLIAEGYAKRHQKLGFQKYLDDAMAESNETVVGLAQSRDIYPNFVDIKLCDELIDLYDKTGRQLYRLRESWSNFKYRKTLND